MKTSFYFFALWLFAAVSLPAQTGLIARIHFLGGDKIAADTNSVAFTNEFCSAEARSFENQTLDKLSVAPSTWFKQKLPTGAIDGPAQLRPLLDDLLKSEWIFEMRDTTNGSPEYALAIRLDAGRAQLWSNNLRTLLESWTKIASQKTATGWRLKKDLPPNLFQFSQKDGWVALDCGQDELPLGDEIMDSISQGQEPGWLSVNLDWPRLAQIFPSLRPFDFPEIAFQTFVVSGNLQFVGRLKLSQPLPPTESWQVPTNVLHQAVVSFTAARSMGPWLERQSWFHLLELQPQPDQFFVWVLPGLPFLTFAAEPVPDARPALAQVEHRLVTETNWQSYLNPPMKTSVADGKLSFVGTPFISPYLQADREAGGDFLFGGFFPNLPTPGALPPGLAEQLATPNLLYYHWEVTSERLQRLPELTQLILLMTRHQQLAAASAGAKWLKKIGPTLGVSETMAMETGLSQVTFIRAAPGGLTALELLGLVNWLDSPDFPALKLPKVQDQ